MHIPSVWYRWARLLWSTVMSTTAFPFFPRLIRSPFTSSAIEILARITPIN